MPTKTVLTENISVSIQSALLSHLDKYCARHDLSRSQVICRATKAFLASKLAEDPAFWERVYQDEEE
jgi:metal-responsive CopG/Arc/MetJ family transcriptional regulator